MGDRNQWPGAISILPALYEQPIDSFPLWQEVLRW